MRFEPNAVSPNVIGGNPANTVTSGVRGATIAGGGALGSTDPDLDDVGPNRVNDVYGTIGGGASNQAGLGSGTTTDQPFATVGGGIWNIASGGYSTVGGGASNAASGASSTISGGAGNAASGLASAVPGGTLNDASGNYSLAAGYRAKALANGAFTFGDSTDADVTGNVANAMVMAFSGGIGLYTNKTKTSGCTVSPAGNFSCTGTIAGAGSGGDITGVAAGIGLAGGGTTGDVTLTIASGYQLPQSCANGQVAKSNGAGGWACSNDLAGGGVTSITAGTGLTGGTITTTGTLAADTAYLQRRVTGTCPAGSSIRVIAADGTVTCEIDDTGPANAFLQGGNTFGTTAVIGTSDNNPVDIRVNNSRVMRYVPGAYGPNVVGGDASNSAGSFSGQTVAGGGSPDSGCYEPTTGTYVRPCANRTNGDYAAVGGGIANQALAHVSVISGGVANTASGSFSAIGGGLTNVATGFASSVGSGESNIASGSRSVIPGGYLNRASGNLSFAAGFRAQSPNQGCFTWADSTNADFTCTMANGFFVRASGGMRLFGPGFWELASTEGDFRIGNDAYRLKFGVALEGGGVGDAWVRAHGGIERLNLWASGGTRVLTNTAATTGVSIAAGSGTWSTLSDRSAKRDLERVEEIDVLERLVAMPIYRWRYIEERSAAAHMGPVAQDFRAAFGLGDDEKTITTVDADGVALAAIQGLNAKLEAKLAARDSEIRALRDEVAKLRASHGDVVALRAAVTELLRERSGAVTRTRLVP
jgi:hypothetical protein